MDYLTKNQAAENWIYPRA